MCTLQNVILRHDMNAFLELVYNNAYKIIIIFVPIVIEKMIIVKLSLMRNVLWIGDPTSVIEIIVKFIHKFQLFFDSKYDKQSV